MNVQRVLLARPRGFCAGVEMAIKSLAWMVRVFEPPVYCYHEIVHNRLVVDRFRDLGVVFVDDVDDVPAGVADPEKVALLAQTTLSLNDWRGILDEARGRFPGLWTATRDDLCFATTNRQAALSAIASRADAVLVIGSANSSNTLALVKVAEEAGCPVVQRINGVEELDTSLLAGARVIGVTAGASAPEEIVDAVIDRLAPAEGVEVVDVTDEDEYFPPPRELRELLPALDAVAALCLGGDPVAAAALGGPFTGDRVVDASDTLSDLR